MIFGGAPTVAQYHGNPRVQAHGPGFSKILLGDDIVDDWEKYLDVMVESVIINGGRSCINCSGIWASRHTKEIAQAIAERVGPTEVKTANDPEAALAAFTNPDMAEAVWGMVRRESLLQDSFSKTEKGLAGKLHEIGKDIVGITQEPKRVAEGP